MPFYLARILPDDEFDWWGIEFYNLHRNWTSDKEYKLRIEETPRENRVQVPPGPPLYLSVETWNSYDLRASWVRPQPRNDDDKVQHIDSYKVQWKTSTGSWDTPADVAEEIKMPRAIVGISCRIRGLTGGIEYEVRVIATKGGADSEPSNTATGTVMVRSAQQSSEENQNRQATGVPGISGTAQVGEILTPTTSDIEDDDGMTGAVFSCQWLRSGTAGDIDIAGATTASYTVEAADEGSAIRVRVTFTDDAGHEESLTSLPTDLVVGVAMQLRSAIVDGVTLTLSYNESLDTSVTLPLTAFTVNVNGTSRSPFGVGAGDTSVLLLLSQAVEAGDAVTVDYTAPGGQDFIQDTQGRKTDSFSGQQVTNITAADKPDEPPPTGTSTEHTVTIVPGNTPVEEGSDAAFTLTLDRAATEGISIGVTVSESGAMLVSATTLVAFAAGDVSRSLSLATLDDIVVEGDSTVTVALASGDGYTLGATTSAEVTVSDNDTATLTLTADPSELAEGATSTVTATTAPACRFPTPTAARPARWLSPKESTRSQ